MTKQNKVWTNDLRDYFNGFKKIDDPEKGLKGIEWLTGISCWLGSVSFWIRVGIHRYVSSKISPSLIIDFYVPFCVAITIAVWWWLPGLPGAIWWAGLCSYFSAETVLVLLHVVFLSKVFGDPESAGRSLILFICNVIQLVFMFSIWYQLQLQMPKEDALLNSVLVFGTLGTLNPPTALVGWQIATDFLLLAIFLAHLVGRVGSSSQDDTQK